MLREGNKKEVPEEAVVVEEKEPSDIVGIPTFDMYPKDLAELAGM